MNKNTVSGLPENDANAVRGILESMESNLESPDAAERSVKATLQEADLDAVKSILEATKIDGPNATIAESKVDEEPVIDEGESVVTEKKDKKKDDDEDDPKSKKDKKKPVKETRVGFNVGDEVIIDAEDQDLSSGLITGTIVAINADVAKVKTESGYKMMGIASLSPVFVSSAVDTLLDSEADVDDEMITKILDDEVDFDSSVRFDHLKSTLSHNA